MFPANQNRHSFENRRNQNKFLQFLLVPSNCHVIPAQFLREKSYASAMLPIATPSKIWNYLPRAATPLTRRIRPG